MLARIEFTEGYKLLFGEWIESLYQWQEGLFEEDQFVWERCSGLEEIYSWIGRHQLYIECMFIFMINHSIGTSEDCANNCGFKEQGNQEIEYFFEHWKTEGKGVDW